MARVQVIRQSKALTFPETDAAEHAAIKALSAGTASERQQIIFYDWLVKKAGMIGGLSFNVDSDRMSNLNEGRRYVAISVVHFTTTPIKPDIQ